MNDWLAPRIAAYRAENPGTALDARGLRERVLAATGRRHRRRLVWLVPIAAVLVGSGALAASAPVRGNVARVLAELGWLAPPITAPHRSVPRRPALAALVTAAPSSAPPVATIAAESAVETAPRAGFAAATPTPPHATHGSTRPLHATTPRSVNGSPSSTRDGADRRDAADALSADITTYRTAHELHFARADYARALAAWDRYLAQYPAGTFAPEARLNRAVCLARLGRTEEAEHALRALADSSHEYTSTRARSLLSALSTDP